MHGKHEVKVRKRIFNRTVVVILLAIAICVSSIVTVMANTVSATVIDGKNVYTFVMSSTQTEEIIAQAQLKGLKPLSYLDVSERVGNTTTVNVRRGVNVRVLIDGVAPIELIAYKGDTVEKTLEDNSILLREKDISQPSRETIVDEDMDITIKRYSKITIEADDSTKTLEFTGSSVEEALKEAGIDIGTDDTVNYSMSETLFDGMNIKVGRVITIKVSADGEVEEHKIAATSVEDALEKLEYKVGDSDSVYPPRTSKLVNGQEIAVKRVETKEVEEKQAVPFEKKEELDSSMYVGETKVKVKGMQGEKTFSYRVTYTDGAETDRKLVSEEVTLDPITEITAVGTKIKEPVSTPAPTPKPTPKPTKKPVPPVTVPQSGENTVTDAAGNVISFSKMITGKGTAYCDTGLTASGHEAGYDYIAVDPSIIPYGTKLYIRSTDGLYERYCIASDTGGNLLNGNVLVDVWFPTESECRTFGVRTMEVFFTD